MRVKYLITWIAIFMVMLGGLGLYLMGWRLSIVELFVWRPDNLVKSLMVENYQPEVIVYGEGSAKSPFGIDSLNDRVRSLYAPKRVEAGVEQVGIEPGGEDEDAEGKMTVSFKVPTFRPVPYRFLVAYTRDAENFEKSSSDETEVRWAELSFNETVLRKVLTENGGWVKMTLDVGEWLLGKGFGEKNSLPIYYVIYEGVILPDGVYVDYHYGDIDKESGRLVPFVFEL